MSRTVPKRDRRKAPRKQTRSPFKLVSTVLLSEHATRQAAEIAMGAHVLRRGEKLVIVEEK